MRSSVLGGWMAAAVACHLAVCTVVHASDHVVMKNGDRLTGEVKKIWNGEVFIETDYADEWALDMSQVAYIHTDETFDIEFRRGHRIEQVTGRLGLDDALLPVVIVTPDTTYPLHDIDNMESIEDFLDWSVLGDLSMNLARGNTETSSGRLYLSGELKLGNHRHLLELTRDEQQSDGEVLKEQTQVLYQDTWTFSEQWFLRGSLTWTRDPIRSLDSRSNLYIGPGIHIWDDSKRTLNFSLGPSYVVEIISGEREESLAYQGMFRYEQKFLRDDLVLFQQTDYSVSFRGRENDVLSTSTGLRYDVTDAIYLSLQVDYHYETNPADESGNADFTYLTGIGIELD